MREEVRQALMSLLAFLSRSEHGKIQRVQTDTAITWAVNLTAPFLASGGV